MREVVQQTGAEVTSKTRTWEKRLRIFETRAFLFRATTATTGREPFN